MNEIFDEVYFDLDKVLVNTIEFESDFTKSYDGFHFLDKGDLYQHIVEPFKSIQPKSYQHLLNGKFFYSIKKKTSYLNGDITQFGILVNDKAFYIRYFPNCYSKKPNYFDFDNIPDFILKSWLYRTDRWSVAERRVMNIYKTRLPSILKTPIHSIISGFEDKKNIDTYSEFLTEKFNFEFRRNY